MRRLRKRDELLIGSLITVPLSMYGAFRVLPVWLGTRPGYFIGFLVYWTLWCGLFPSLVVTPTECAHLLKEPTSDAWRRGSTVVLLVWPLAVTYAAAFPRAAAHADIGILAVSALLAVVNGVAEEWLWRGAFLTAFPSERVRGVVLPALGFAVWHFAPQTVFPNPYPGGAWSLVVFSLLLGLSWGEVVRRTGNLTVVIVCHVLLDFSGLGGRLYFS